MARLLTCGFEMGDIRAEPSVGGVSNANPTLLNGTPTVDTGTVRSGSRSLKINVTSEGQAVRWAGFGGLETPQYHRLYVRFQAFPSTSAILVTQRPTGVGFRINSSGVLAARFNDASDLATTALSLNTWYRLEMMQTIRAAATDDIEYRVDGTTLFQSLGVERSATNSNNYDIGYGTTGNGCIFYVDDVAVNDNAAGTGQTSWPGSGKVVMLNPISDNSTTGYTGGAGGTTSLFDAVDNRPPTGTTAALDTNTTQIKSVNSNTTDNYQANLTTYTNAGIGAGDTVNVVQPFHRFANPTILTTRQQAIQGTSNPAVTESATNQSGVIAAAEISTSWLTRTTVPSYAPSVTLGTSPVIRTRKATASTNEAAVDAMGMYVDYTPAGTTPAMLVFGTAAAVSNATLALSATAYGAAVLADSPRVWYRLGESSGQPQDSSGNGNHTTGTEGSPTYSRPGAIKSEPSNNAIGFAASPAKAFYADEPNTIELGDTFTLEAWVNPSGSGDRTICSVEAEQEIRINAAGELELLRSNIASVVTSTVTVPNGTWTHVVAAKAGATVKLYINGVDRTGSVTSVTLSSDDVGAFWVGRQGGGAHFIGDLDEIAAYATALSQARVQAHYEAGIGPQIPLGPAAAVSSATLAVTIPAVPAVIPLSSAPATSNATLAVTAATRITLATCPTLSNATLAVTAATRITLSSAPATSNATLALTAVARLTLSSSPSQSAATLTLTAAARVVLSSSPALSSATLALTAATGVILGTADAISSATCVVEILVVYQYARPESDVAATGWTVAPLWSKLDETTASDADFVTGVAS